MRKTVVLNVVGLSRRNLGPHTPFLKSYLDRSKMSAIHPVLPAVTCSAQATYITGKTPDTHGIVGNGWYFSEEKEIKFWRQSASLIQAPNLWETLQAEYPEFRCAYLFWWYNMYSGADYSITPRPNYLADGRKIPDVYSYPSGWRDALQKELGQFPLFRFWGPKADLVSSKWIQKAALRTDKAFDPTLSFIYLPHLDYDMQRFGPDDPRVHKALEAVDTLVEELVRHYEAQGASIIILSEYGITPVSRALFPNRILRESNLLAIREERGLELLDAGASEAFAVADHQIAHIYVRDKARLKEVYDLFKGEKGIERVLDKKAQAEVGLSHERSGDLVLIADRDSWFTYYFWMEDKKAPDYARMVDIHRKPGYDPVELFTDPEDPWIMLKILAKLLKKKLGFRSPMNVIPLKPELVRGSHGRIPDSPEDYPVFISNRPELVPERELKATEVRGLIEDHLLK